jgi:hypothetical protein
LSKFTGTISSSPQFLTVMTLRARLPFFSQLKIPKFDNTDITRFIKEWDDICKNYEIKAIKKIRRVPKYIIKVIREYVRA